MPEGRVLALVGPTGAGKSTIALDVAEGTGAEIVAVDAFTVYRGMDVGTAKPSAEDRRRVRHHLLDLLDPWERCTVAWFQQHAQAAVDGILAAGRIPLLVGGSGLYFRAVVDPLEFPPHDDSVRRRLEQRWAAAPAAAHAHLAARDPAAAARIDPGNLRRTVRALEVLEVTGRPFSTYRTHWTEYASRYPGLRAVALAVEPAELGRRIEARVARMLDAGLVEECRRLARHPLSSTARQAIGYREVLDHLEGRCSLDEAATQIVVRTRRYAARQLRWFRSDPRLEWMAPADAGRALVADPRR